VKAADDADRAKGERVTRSIVVAVAVVVAGGKVN